MAEFVGATAPLAGVKPGSGSGAASEIDMITGATISSRAVIAIINHRVEAVAPLLDEYFRSAAVEPGASSTVAGAGGGP